MHGLRISSNTLHTLLRLPSLVYKPSNDVCTKESVKIPRFSAWAWRGEQESEAKEWEVEAALKREVKVWPLGGA